MKTKNITMKTKKITKKQAKEFLTLLNKTAAEIGFSEPTGTGASRSATISTDFGTYTLQLPDPKDDNQVDPWCCGFTNLPGFYGGFYGRFGDTTKKLPHDANPYSGNWNHYGNTAEQACDELHRCMAFVGAKSTALV